MSFEKVSKARDFAIASHGDQRRKYTNEPYWKHLAEVAGIVATVPNVTEEMVMAAWLHDTVEDTHVTLAEIYELFGQTVVNYVAGLTEISKPEDGNRHFRKARNRAYLASTCGDVQTIKYADMISNTGSILVHDQSFARLYYFEKKALTDVLWKGQPGLRDLLYKQLKQMADTLNITSVETYHWWLKQPQGLYDARLEQGLKG